VLSFWNTLDELYKNIRLKQTSGRVPDYMRLAQKSNHQDLSASSKELLLKEIGNEIHRLKDRKHDIETLKNQKQE